MSEHDLAPWTPVPGLRWERRPCRGPDGLPVDDLAHVWITLENPDRLNAYTTDMLRGLVLGFQRASVARDAVSVVLTGTGERAFCTGGDALHYARAYAARPDEFRAYLGLFAAAIDAILRCDKPVICRVNGMRLAGGQELGMACDVSVAQDLAVFGQVGARHGSAPVMGATAFLPLFVGIEAATVACTTGESWSAHEALRRGLVAEIVPGLLVDGVRVANPLVETARWLDERGAIVHGRPRTGEALEEGRALLRRGRVDLALLDEAVQAWGTRFLQTTPGALAKTLEGLRRPKRELWDRHREGDRLWLAANMATEGRVGFEAFARGRKDRRQADFVELRRRLARGERWDEALVEGVLPRAEPPAGGGA